MNNSPINKIIESKVDLAHDALDLTASVRNDLFDNVALALSRVEGKLSFLLSEGLDGNPRIADGFSQEVAQETKEMVNKTRHELDKVFIQLSEGRSRFLNL